MGRIRVRNINLHAFMTPRNEILFTKHLSEKGYVGLQIYRFFFFMGPNQLIFLLPHQHTSCFFVLYLPDREDVFGNGKGQKENKARVCSFSMAFISANTGGQ